MEYTKKEYLTVRHIARKVGVSGTSIRDAIKKGELPGIMQGRKWLVEKGDFDAFFKYNPEIVKIKKFLNAADNPPFLTIPDVMRLFRIAYSTAYRWINQYFYLITTKIANRLYIPIESVREFITHYPEKVIFRHCYS